MRSVMMSAGRSENRGDASPCMQSGGCNLTGFTTPCNNPLRLQMPQQCIL